MAGTPGRAAFTAYLNAVGVEDALPWEDQDEKDQKAWEKAATGVKLTEPDPEPEDQDEVGPDELRLDAAHEEG